MCTYGVLPACVSVTLVVSVSTKAALGGGVGDSARHKASLHRLPAPYATKSKIEMCTIAELHWDKRKTKSIALENSELKY